MKADLGKGCWATNGSCSRIDEGSFGGPGRASQCRLQMVASHVLLFTRRRLPQKKPAPPGNHSDHHTTIFYPTTRIELEASESARADRDMPLNDYTFLGH